MTSTTSVIPLRYDSPTVTLEVMARAAAISQWSDKPVVQVLRYRLILRSLSDEAEPTEIEGDRASFLPLVNAVQDYIQGHLSGTATPAPERSSSAIYLEAEGLTQYRLHLGKLSLPTGTRTVVLGALQLADLGDVLAQLEAAVRPLAVTLTPTRQRRPWKQLGAAAAGIVAAVGVTTVLWPTYQVQQGTNDTALETPTTDQAPEDSQELEAVERSRPPTAADPVPESAEETVPTTETAAPDRSVAANSAPPESNGDVAPAPPPSTTATAPAPAADNDSSTPSNDDLAETASPPSATSAPEPAAGMPAPPATAPVPPADAPPEVDIADANELDRAQTGPGASTETTAETFSAPAARQAEPNPEAGTLAALVQTVRDRWAPPADLSQSLVYTLLFAADGTLTEIVPADDLAAQYRDRTGIPAVGSEWSAAEMPQQLELQFQPNGDVEWRDANGE